MNAPGVIALIATTYFYLYVVLDIFSRYAVGWMVADENALALAGRLIERRHVAGSE